MEPRPAVGRPEGITATRAFVADRFPDALAVLLAGSVTRGRATATSDLDLVLVTQRPEAPYRETFHAHGWPIEAFVYTPTTYRTWFEQDRKRRRPSLPTMCAEGVVLKDTDGLATLMRAEARDLLEAGPEPLTSTELAAARYRITDLLMDLESVREEELPFVVVALVPALADLICDVFGRWRGDAKWTLRAVRAASPELAERLATALAEVMRDGNARPLIVVADAVLAMVGGRLFEGYAAGKGSA